MLFRSLKQGNFWRYKETVGRYFLTKVTTSDGAAYLKTLKYYVSAPFHGDDPIELECSNKIRHTLKIGTMVWVMMGPGHKFTVKAVNPWVVPPKYRDAAEEVLKRKGHNLTLTAHWGWVDWELAEACAGETYITDEYVRLHTPYRQLDHTSAADEHVMLATKNLTPDSPQVKKEELFAPQSNNFRTHTQIADPNAILNLTIKSQPRDTGAASSSRKITISSTQVEEAKDNLETKRRAEQPPQEKSRKPSSSNPNELEKELARLKNKVQELESARAADKRDQIEQEKKTALALKGHEAEAQERRNLELQLAIHLVEQHRARNELNGALAQIIELRASLDERERGNLENKLKNITTNIEFARNELGDKDSEYETVGRQMELWDRDENHDPIKCPTEMSNVEDRDRMIETIMAMVRRSNKRVGDASRGSDKKQGLHIKQTTRAERQATKDSPRIDYKAIHKLLKELLTPPETQLRMDEEGWAQLDDIADTLGHKGHLVSCDDIRSMARHGWGTDNSKPCFELKKLGKLDKLRIIKEEHKEDGTGNRKTPPLKPATADERTEEAGKTPKRARAEPNVGATDDAPPEPVRKIMITSREAPRRVFLEQGASGKASASTPEPKPKIAWTPHKSTWTTKRTEQQGWQWPDEEDPPELQITHHDNSAWDKAHHPSSTWEQPRQPDSNWQAPSACQTSDTWQDQEWGPQWDDTQMDVTQDQGGWGNAAQTRKRNRPDRVRAPRCRNIPQDAKYCDDLECTYRPCHTYCKVARTSNLQHCGDRVCKNLPCKHANYCYKATQRKRAHCGIDTCQMLPCRDFWRKAKQLTQSGTGP